MVTYTHLRQSVYQIDFDFSHNTSVITEELSKIAWEPWWLPDVHSAARQLPRSNGSASDVPSLKEAATYFIDPNGYKADILTELYKDPEFGLNWSMDYDTLMKNTIGICSLFKDEPGFTTTIHLDNRKLVTTGMITFSDSDKPNISTTFFTTEQGDNPLRVPIGNGKGWSAAVTHNTWHTGGNLSDEVRYSLYFAIALKLDC